MGPKTFITASLRVYFNASLRRWAPCLVGLALAFPLCRTTAGEAAVYDTAHHVQDVNDRVPIQGSLGIRLDWTGDSLTGSFQVDGCDPAKRQISHTERAGDGVFSTVGQIVHARSDGTPLIYQHVAFISIPSEKVSILFDHAVAARDIMVLSQEGVRLPLNKELLGLCSVRYPGGSASLARSDMQDRAIGEQWLSLGGKLAVVALTSNSAFTVRRPKDSGWVVDLPYIREPHSFYTDGLVRYSVVVLAAGDSRTAADISRHSRLISSGSAQVRCAVVSKDGRCKWLVAVNFGGRTETVNADIDGHKASFDVGPMSAEIRKLD